jgi:hypothetical protein
VWREVFLKKIAKEIAAKRHKRHQKILDFFHPLASPTSVRASSAWLFIPFVQQELKFFVGRGSSIQPYCPQICADEKLSPLYDIPSNLRTIKYSEV